MIGRLVQVHPRRVGGHHGAPAAGDLAQRDEKERDPAGHQQDALKQVGPHHRSQSAANAIRPHDDRNPHQHRAEVPAGDLREGQAARVEHGDHVDGYIDEQEETRKDRAARRTEAIGQKPGNRDYPVLKINGDENDQHQGIDGQDEPLPVGDSQPVLIGNADRADQLLAGNPRGDEGRADQVPGHFVAAQEIAVGRVRAETSGNRSHQHDQAQRSDDDDDVDRAQRRGHVAWLLVG